MSTADRRVDPTTAAARTEPVRNDAPGRESLRALANPAGARAGDDAPAVRTTGGLRPAYAQYVIDAQTHEVSVRIRDAATDEVIRQIPSAEVAAANRALRNYAEALALRHAAAQGKAGA